MRQRKEGRKEGRKEVGRKEGEGWTDGWREGWRDGWMEGWKNGGMEGWKRRKEWKDGWTNGLRNGRSLSVKHDDDGVSRQYRRFSARLICTTVERRVGMRAFTFSRTGIPVAIKSTFAGTFVGGLDIRTNGVHITAWVGRAFICF